MKFWTGVPYRLGRAEYGQATFQGLSRWFAFTTFELQKVLLLLVVLVFLLRQLGARQIKFYRFFCTCSTTRCKDKIYQGPPNTCRRSRQLFQSRLVYPY